MQQGYILSFGRNARSESGVLRVFFDAFSSRNTTTPILHYAYTHCISSDFVTCSFTGKERDEETGYGYFGARYMDYELMTGWLSVDPKDDKYPSISPYNYCMWNPVRVVDPNGMDTLISFACKTNNPKANAANENLCKSIRNIGDSPFALAIAMHGTPKSVDMATSDGTGTKPTTAKDLAQRIESDGNSLYVDNLANSKPTIIVLYSCNTGQGEDCFGQQLSNELESSIVIAPEGAVWAGINKDGRTTIDNAVNLGTAEEPQKGARSNWNVFFNGEKVMSFKGDAPQAWINKQGGASKFMEKVKGKIGK